AVAQRLIVKHDPLGRPELRARDRVPVIDQMRVFQRHFLKLHSGPRQTRLWFGGVNWVPRQTRLWFGGGNWSPRKPGFGLWGKPTHEPILLSKKSSAEIGLCAFQGAAQAIC